MAIFCLLCFDCFSCAVCFAVNLLDASVVYVIVFCCLVDQNAVWKLLVLLLGEFLLWFVGCGVRWGVTVLGFCLRFVFSFGLVVPDVYNSVAYCPCAYVVRILRYLLFLCFWLLFSCWVSCLVWVLLVCICLDAFV